MNANVNTYRWPDLSPVFRQYVVRDDLGRFGIAYSDPEHHQGVLFAHPVEVAAFISPAGVAGAESLPANAILMTNTPWHLQEDGTYMGTWYDYNGPQQVPQNLLRRVTIVDDLGYLLHDKWAAQVLAAGSEEGWNYGATIGKIGGEPPVKGQKPNEMTVNQAEDYAAEVGELVSARAIRQAADRGYIPGARKAGRDWLIPYDGFNHYLDNRPKRGPKKTQ